LVATLEETLELAKLRLVDGELLGAIGQLTPAVYLAANAANVDTANAPAAPAAELVTVTTDVLRLTIDTRGGSLVRAELLAYPDSPVTKNNPAPPPVRLLNDSTDHYFAAQDGLVSTTGAAPDHRAM